MNADASKAASAPDTQAAGEDIDSILEITAAMGAELRGGVDSPPLALTPGSHLERDVGLDSLSRMELLSRIEAATGAHLDEQAVMSAETVSDLWRALRGLDGGRVPESLADGSPWRDLALDTTPEIAGEPLREATLLDALHLHLRIHPERTHLKLLDEHGASRDTSYAELYRAARAIAWGLLAQDIGSGDTVAIMLPTDASYLQSFLGCMMVGAVPVPIYPPARPKQIEEHFNRHVRILENARVRALITFKEALGVSRVLGAPVPTLTRVVTPEQLSSAPRVPISYLPEAEDVAFLQYTSGSTGDPKGVVLTHANIMASLRSMAIALDAGPKDVFVSWLPLYHDMGLIGAWFGALAVGFPLLLMSPLTFLARPIRWLDAISRYRGTISGGPNFAYDLCLRRITDQELESLDLSSWRAAFNGAEPISAATMEAFAQRFAPCGFSSQAMMPVYGLAEATLGVAFTPLGRGPKVEHVERESLYRRGRARAAAQHGTEGVDQGRSAQVMACVSCGVPIPGFEVRVVSEDGAEQPDRVEGAVQFRGPGATPGYFRNPEGNHALTDGEWSVTGDRGFFLDGELYITGRDKDLVIRAGRNLYPYALELAAAEVPGVRRGCVAVFASSDPENRTESLVVLAETRERDPELRAAMARDIEALALEHLGVPADDVVLAVPHTVLKTSSGKIRRSALAASYADGSLARVADRAVWLQLLRLAVGAVAPWSRAALVSVRQRLFTGWCLLALAAAVTVTWPLVVASRDVDSAWRRAGRGVRALFRLCAVSLEFDAMTPPTETATVLVSNHQSYLDGLALVASLERPVRFVAKRELAKSFVARRFLQAIGVLFVERFDRHRAVVDADAVVEALEQGDSVLFFAEGTFHRMAGLLPFQLGAFETALRASVPILPLVIRGSRNVLRGDDISPHPGLIQVQALEPIPVESVQPPERWSASLQLRQRVRERILEHCGEPDLAAHALRTRLNEARD